MREQMPPAIKSLHQGFLPSAVNGSTLVPGADPGGGMGLHGFSDHGQRAAVLIVVAEDLTPPFKAGDGFMLFHRQAISPGLRGRTRRRRRSLLVFGDVAGRVCTQGVAIRPEGKSENSKADDDNGSHDRQIRVRRFSPLARWFGVGHGVHSSGVATSCGCNGEMHHSFREAVPDDGD